MACYNKIAAQHFRSLVKLAELQMVIAVYAGIRSSTHLVAVRKLIHDHGTELVLVIEYVERHAESERH